jgi:hypothetical protein
MLSRYHTGTPERPNAIPHGPQPSFPHIPNRNFPIPMVQASVGEFQKTKISSRMLIIVLLGDVCAWIIFEGRCF